MSYSYSCHIVAGSCITGIAEIPFGSCRGSIPIIFSLQGSINKCLIATPGYPYIIGYPVLIYRQSRVRPVFFCKGYRRSICHGHDQLPVEIIITGVINIQRVSGDISAYQGINKALRISTDDRR